MLNGINQFEISFELVFVLQKCAKIPLDRRPFFLKLLRLYYWWLTQSQLSLRCHITVCLMALFNWRITSAIYSKFCRRDRTHPPSPAFIVSSRTNRDRIPWAVILQLVQIPWEILRLSKLSYQKLNKYMLHSYSIADVLHIRDVVIQCTGHPGFSFGHLLN